MNGDPVGEARPRNCITFTLRALGSLAGSGSGSSDGVFFFVPATSLINKITFAI